MYLLSLLAQRQPPPGSEGAAAAGLVFFIVAFLCIGLLIVFSLAIFIWALVDCIKNQNLDQNQRLIWILVIVLTNPIGGIVYLIIGRKKK